MNKRNRSTARLAAVQALYEMDVGGKGLNDIFAEFSTFWIAQTVEGVAYDKADEVLFRDVVQGVVDRQVAIDRMTDTALSEKWPLRRVESVMRAVFRAAGYELVARSDVPARVVVKEYVDVAAAFLAKEETNMVNAVLDSVARQQRSAEFSQPVD